MLANQAGLAIENSRLFELTKHKSHTDSLTGLWNHGFFQDKLGEEIKKTQDFSQPIGLLMIDIDNFKQLNDRFGHHNGDKALKEIAKILKEESRDADFVCRYGGEEFAVILTQTDLKQSISIAERIRMKITGHTFPQFNNGFTPNITVSIGLAMYPSDQINTKEHLIAKADKAMYTAKESGKNQTCVGGQ